MARTAASKASTRKPARTSSHYHRWSKSEVRELRQLARAHLPMREIGRKLGRTPVSIRGKAQREGISLRAGSAETRRRARGKR
jgi:IS30 family transposase